MEFTFKPIGVLHTPYKRMSGVPIQGIFDPESQGKAEVYQEFEAGLKDIEGFSHLILIYVFDRADGYELICRPYMEEASHGVFAIRAPKRPNPIGFSVVKLMKRDGNILFLSEVDMLDRTPLLDIKPFVPRFDHRRKTRIGWMEGTFRNGGHRRISDDRF